MTSTTTVSGATELVSGGRPDAGAGLDASGDAGDEQLALRQDKEVRRRDVGGAGHEPVAGLVRPVHAQRLEEDKAAAVTAPSDPRRPDLQQAGAGRQVRRVLRLQGGGGYRP